MKIFFLSILVCLAAVLSRNIFAGEEKFDLNQNLAAEIYRNEKFGYEIGLLYGFTVDESVPELVVIENLGIKVRVNSGCFDFGLENLIVTTSLVSVHGMPALREDFYSENKLVLSRITINSQDRCFSIEITGDSQDDWEKGHLLARSFRLTR